MANYEATRYDWDGQYLTSVQGINTGLIIPWGSASIPSGFLECNGQAVSTSTYAALFAVVGYTYGNPGGGNFNIPDLTDKTVVHKSNTKSLATSGGANTVARTGNLGGTSDSTAITTPQMPSHAHMNAINLSSPGGGGGESTPAGNYSAVTSAATGSDQGHTHGISGSLTSNTDSVLQPYIVVIYIIKT
jgi:microcystin-dependent protein